MTTQTIDYVRTYYKASAGAMPERPALKGDMTCDICIVGAGYAGINTALELAERGYKVIVLEAARVGWGASGRNAGAIVNGFSRGYDSIKNWYGTDTARAFLEMSFEGADIIRERIKKYNIACDHRDTATFFAAFNDNHIKNLERDTKIWEQSGHKGLELIDRKKAGKTVGTEQYCGGLLDYWGGHMHPLKLVLGEAAALESLGGKIHEQSAVTRIDYDDKPAVFTAGGKVSANKIILCGGAYLDKVVPRLAHRAMPVSSKIITTEVLGDDVCNRILPTDVCVEDCNFVIEYYHLTADKRLLFGGGLHYGRPDSPKIVTELQPNMVRTFPFLKDVKIEFSWSCAMSFTYKRLPHIGRLSDSVYFIQGFSGHGVTTTHLVGRLMAESITEQTSRLDVLSQMKHYPFPGGRTFRVPLTVMGAWYYELRDRLGI